MTDPEDRRAASQRAAAKVLREEVERAERRGAEQVRRRVLAIPPDKRYLHRVGDLTVEVIDAAAVEEAVGHDQP